MAPGRWEVGGWVGGGIMSEMTALPQSYPMPSASPWSLLTQVPPSSSHFPPPPLPAPPKPLKAGGAGSDPLRSVHYLTSSCAQQPSPGLVGRKGIVPVQGKHAGLGPPGLLLAPVGGGDGPRGSLQVPPGCAGNAGSHPFPRALLRVVSTGRSPREGVASS